MTPAWTPEKCGLSTPALLIDLDIMERNISNMANYLRHTKTSLRPHIKTHKSPVIAHKQIRAGANGITCHTLREAEVMAAAGIRDVLVTHQIVDQLKIQRLISLARHSDVIVSIDSITNGEDLSEAALRKGVELNFAIEISNGRCGLPPGEPAVSFAQKLMRLKGLNFKGIWSHCGTVARIKSFQERKAQAEKSLNETLRTREMLEHAGIHVEIVSAGSTADYKVTANCPGITEVEAGSYVFMDATLRALEGLDEFGCALSVLATVVSRPSDNKAIVDMGNKATSLEQGLPQVRNREGVELVALNEEHGHLTLKGPGKGIRVGDRIEFIPSHCCGTVNLHNKYHGIRESQLETVWDIPAKYS